MSRLHPRFRDVVDEEGKRSSHPTLEVGSNLHQAYRYLGAMLFNPQ